jgi:hypothetical protein
MSDPKTDYFICKVLAAANPNRNVESVVRTSTDGELADMFLGGDHVFLTGKEAPHVILNHIAAFRERMGWEMNRDAVKRSASGSDDTDKIEADFDLLEDAIRFAWTYGHCCTQDQLTDSDKRFLRELRATRDEARAALDRIKAKMNKK